MKSFHTLAIAAVSLACLAGPSLAQSPSTPPAQGAALAVPQFDAQGIARTETARAQFDGSRQAIQVLVDFAPGAAFPPHSHPGVEIAYVARGEIEYAMDGKTIRLQAGQSLYIPAGTVHSAKNIGADITSELATYLVDTGKPLVVLAK